MYNSSELPIEFTSPLKDQNVKEGQTATFDFEVNIIDLPVTWLINGKEVKPDNRHEMVSKGCKHTMYVKESILPDMGEVVAKIEDKTTKAKLTVTGEFNFIVYCLLIYQPPS